MRTIFLRHLWSNTSRLRVSFTLKAMLLVYLVVFESALFSDTVRETLSTELRLTICMIEIFVLIRHQVITTIMSFSPQYRTTSFAQATMWSIRKQFLFSNPLFYTFIYCLTNRICVFFSI